MHWIDPESLPEVTGTVERFVLNPHGEIDGFVMTGQARTAILVHTPPHMGSELAKNVKPGDAVGVRGVRPRTADMVAAVAITAPSGRQLVDEGPGHAHEHPKPDNKKMSAQGTVRLSLFGPKGELRGALLTDGTVVRVGPKEAKEIAGLLKAGASLAATGDGVETPHGRVVHAKEIGSHCDDLRPIKAAKPKPKPDHKHEVGHPPKPEARA